MALFQPTPLWRYKRRGFRQAQPANRGSLRTTGAARKRRSHPTLLIRSVSVKLRDGAGHVFDLREDVVFNLRRVGDKGVERGDAADGRVQVFKQFVRDARGYFSTEAVCARVFVRDDDLV